MSDFLQQQLDDSTINQQHIFDFVSQLATGKDYGDCYFQHTQNESFILEDNIIKDASFHTSSGVGVRAVIGEKTGFAYSDILGKQEIQKSVDFAKSITGKGQSKILPFVQKPIRAHYTSFSPLVSLQNEEKVFILQKINEIARKNKYITQVNASISGAYSEVLIASSDGVFAKDYRPMVRISISVVAQKNGRTESASSGGGGRYDYRYFIDNKLYQQYTLNAVEQVMINLEAKEAPAGNMPVILGGGWPGVLLHEAIGHGLEGDFNRKKTSVFTDKIGEKIAHSKCTIVDNGTLANRRGSLNIDDEGVESQNTVLVENGILKGYMFDKMNAKLMGVQSTGNGRRESYAHLPMPRMTNTYMLAGNDTQDEMIASVDKGIFATNFAGGQVDITSGNFVFSASNAYLIENGKLKHPIKGATISGVGFDALTKISMVGDDLSLDSGVGVCGKNGQSVPVGVGQPSLKIDELIVGGTN
jgi:TldD protein